MSGITTTTEDFSDKDIVVKTKQYLKEHNIQSPPTDTPYRIKRGNTVYICANQARYEAKLAELEAEDERERLRQSYIPPVHTCHTCLYNNPKKHLKLVKRHCSHPDSERTRIYNRTPACEMYKSI